MCDNMVHAKRFRPTPSTRDLMFSSTPEPCSLNVCSSGPEMFSAWNFHPSDEENERELLSNKREAFIGRPRWNPTPEQIEALQQMYKTGLRTPSAQQIHKIASNLRSFGKIEGKNVFYWFQNHKARERQKRRRLLGVHNLPHMNDNNIGTNLRLKDPEINKKIMDVQSAEERSSCSRGTYITEDSVSRNIGVMAESRRNRWEKELQEQTGQSKRFKKVTFQMNTSPCPNYYIFSTTITTQQSSKHSSHYIHSNEKNHASTEEQILQLFPLGRNHQSDTTPKEEESGMLSANNATISPRQFFEFLPLKS